MIQQRVRLSKRAHAKIASAQRAIGLARFDEALGYLLDGILATAPHAWIVGRIRKGMKR